MVEGFTASASSESTPSENTGVAAPSKARKPLAVQTTDGAGAAGARRTFSIDDGGIRLPVGVQTQE